MYAIIGHQPEPRKFDSSGLAQSRVVFYMPNDAHRQTFTRQIILMTATLQDVQFEGRYPKFKYQTPLEIIHVHATMQAGNLMYVP